MDAAKIRLSPEEQALLLNSDWILTKNGILLKVRELFADLQANQLEWMQQHPELLSQEIATTSAKISRGDNYQGLPYLVLDYPRLFGQEDVFAVRTFFWWGHFFSCTLQVSGRFQRQYQEAIIDSYNYLKDEGYYLSVHSDPWQHHFGEDNYRRVSSLDAKQFGMQVTDGSFIKLSKKFSLEQWNEAGRNLMESFSQLIGMLAA